MNKNDSVWQVAQLPVSCANSSCGINEDAKRNIIVCPPFYHGWRTFQVLKAPYSFAILIGKKSHTRNSVKCYLQCRLLRWVNMFTIVTNTKDRTSYWLWVGRGSDFGNQRIVVHVPLNLKQWIHMHVRCYIRVHCVTERFSCECF
jgi:hypothetical protein